MNTPENQEKPASATLWQFEVRASLGGSIFLLKHSGDQASSLQEAHVQFGLMLDEARTSFEQELCQRLSRLFENSPPGATAEKFL